MRLTHQYTLVCEEMRIENNGKYLILGLFTPNIGVAHIPFVLPALCFFQGLESDGPGAIGFRFTIQHLESGRIIGQGMGTLRFGRPGFGVNAIQLRNIPFERDGAYTFAISYDEHDAITTNFGVSLAPPQQQTFHMGTTPQ